MPTTLDVVCFSPLLASECGFGVCKEVPRFATSVGGLLIIVEDGHGELAHFDSIVNLSLAWNNTKER